MYIYIQKTNDVYITIYIYNANKQNTYIYRKQTSK